MAVNDNGTIAEGQMWITFVAALILGGLLIAGQAKGEKPRLWFWPLMVLAFVAWTVGASAGFRELLDVTEKQGAWFLALIAAFVPGVDTGLEKLFPPKE